MHATFEHSEAESARTAHQQASERSVQSDGDHGGGGMGGSGDGLGGNGDEGKSVGGGGDNGEAAMAAALVVVVRVVA